MLLYLITSNSSLISDAEILKLRIFWEQIFKTPDIVKCSIIFQSSVPAVDQHWKLGGQDIHINKEEPEVCDGC